MERDPTGVSVGIYFVNFNSHAHVERDRICEFEEILVKMISTHTLTWSVTISISFLRLIIYISTHTLTWSVTSSGFYHGRH